MYINICVSKTQIFQSRVIFSVGLQQRHFFIFRETPTPSVSERINLDFEALDRRDPATFRWKDEL
jgi:hypothetical protein